MMKAAAKVGLMVGVLAMGGAGAAFAENTVCLTQALSFADKPVTGCLTAQQAADLMDRPILLGGEEKKGKGLELTHPTDIREKKSVKTCRDYQAATGEDWFAMTTYDMTIEGHFQKHCGLLALIAKATPSKTDHLPKTPVTQVDPEEISVAVLALFDPEGTENLDRAAEQGRTLKDYADRGALEVTEQTPTRLDIDFRSMSGSIQELARGDFSGDGVKDALVTCGVRAQGGSYRVTDLMVVTKRSANGLLEVVD